MMDEKWNPMAEDYTNHSFNSYNRGPASGLGVNGAGRAGAPRRHRLFVRGLPKEMTNKGLENLFSSVATVTDCYVKPSDRPSTYGFVNVNSGQDVETCIRKLNGHQIKDHSIFVSMAREGPNEHSNRDGGRPTSRPSPSGDARGMRGASAPRSPPSNMNNGVSMNGNGHSTDETGETNRAPVQQTSPMSSMRNAGCEECQRHLMALMSHMQQAHSQGATQGGTQGATQGATNTSPNKASPNLINGNSQPYNGPSRDHKSDQQQDQQQANSRSTRGQSPTDRGQAESFQQSPRGSAFSRPSPKSPGGNKPVPVPLSKEEDSPIKKGDSTAVPPGRKTPSSEKNKAECDLKPCEACEKPGTKHCSKCRATYCSVVCQKGDWKRHKNACKPNQSSDQSDAGASPPELASDNLKYVEPTKKEMKALVTHLNNPGSFWIQVGDETNVKLYSQMSTLIMEQLPASGPLQDPKPGMTCISKYAEDDSWYRATIQTVEKDRTATVIMIDFGNTEKVPFSDLRPASTEVMDFPVLGLHCSIAGVEPRGSKWCYDSVKLMDKLTKESPMSSVCFEGKKAGIYQVILKTKDDKSGTISVGDALIKHELAWPKGSQPSAAPRKVLMRVSMKRLPIALGGEPVKIAINNYISPKEMQCQIITAESLNALEGLSLSLNECIGGQPQQSGFIPKLGEVCAGRFTQDDQWYRVNIQSAQIEGGYFVEYLDFGNTEVLESSRMCPLPTQFHDIPHQSFKASLAGLPPGDISADLLKATRQRLSQCKDGFFLATFTEQKDDLVFMDVQDPDTVEDIAQAVGLVKVKAKGHRVSDMTFRTILPNTDTEFAITEAVSPAEFYGFSPSEKESSQIIGLLAEGGKEVGSQPTEQNFRPSVGDICWAQFSCDNDWYRAAVLEELPNDKYDVQYIDYGNGEKVHLSLMRPMSNNVAAVPVLSIKCSIAGLPRYTGPWSSELTDSLKEMVGVGSKKIIIRAIEQRNNVTYMQLEDPSTGLNISQEIISQVKESSSGVEPSSVSGPSSLSSHPSLGDARGRQQQPSTPNQPRSAPANMLSPEQIHSMEEQLAMLQAQIKLVKGMST